MFTVYSAIEVEDLYYAILTRIQAVEAMRDEAQNQMQGGLAETYQHELARLNLIKNNLEAHTSDHDYRFDVIHELFPEGSG